MTEVDDPLKRELKEHMGPYLDGVTETGIVQGLLIGTKEGVKMGFIWTIYDQDYPLGVKDDSFGQLGQHTYELKKSLKGKFPLRVAGVNPSGLKELQRSCQQQGLKTEVFALKEGLE